MRRQGAARTIRAVPVAPRDVLPTLAAVADEVVCLVPADRFLAVGDYYDDFGQLTDAQTVALLRQAWAPAGPA
jgi:predicted phosphoribosyltransferase